MKEKNEVRKEFGKRLQKLRTASGITQEQLADIMHTHFMTVSRWERGLYCPNLDQLAFLARHFHVTTDYLLGIGDEDFDLCFDMFFCCDEVEELHGKDNENEI